MAKYFFRGEARIKEAKFELFRLQEAKLATLKHFMVRRPGTRVSNSAIYSRENETIIGSCLAESRC